MRVRDRDRDKAAQKRAERAGWRPQQASQASRSMDEHLRKLSDQANVLEGRLRRHAEERASWHKEWDDPRRT